MHAHTSTEAPRQTTMDFPTACACLLFSTKACGFCRAAWAITCIPSTCSPDDKPLGAGRQVARAGSVGPGGPHPPPHTPALRLKPTISSLHHAHHPWGNEMEGRLSAFPSGPAHVGHGWILRRLRSPCPHRHLAHRILETAVPVHQSISEVSQLDWHGTRPRIRHQSDSWTLFVCMGQNPTARHANASRDNPKIPRPLPASPVAMPFENSSLAWLAMTGLAMSRDGLCATFL